MTATPAAVIASSLLCATAVCWLWPELRAPAVLEGNRVTATAAQIEAGEYLVRAGNCVVCHTAPGGGDLAGGRPIRTPFGDVFSSNLTPDATGIGTWTAANFWRAMHYGRSKNGRRLYPAFPYTNYTLLSRDDSDAIFAYLQSLQPVRAARIEPTVRFPYNTGIARVVWRRLYFEPRHFTADPARSAAWNRGAYLTEGLGHCDACHSRRDRLGGIDSEAAFGGGEIPMLGWDAPALTRYMGLDAAGRAELARLLSVGISDRDVLTGPMAEVVLHSLQYLRSKDIEAIVAYLADLPRVAPGEPDSPRHALGTRDRQQLSAGAQIYTRHCQDCHGADGNGEPYTYPALAGNSLVTAGSATNVVRSILAGGFPASTAGNPRPFGMPPYSHLLSEQEVAAVATYVRWAWGNNAAPVSLLTVQAR